MTNYNEVLLGILGLVTLLATSEDKLRLVKALSLNELRLLNELILLDELLRLLDKLLVVDDDAPALVLSPEQLRVLPPQLIVLGNLSRRHR